MHAIVISKHHLCLVIYLLIYIFFNFQFRFATACDKLLIIIGVICSALHGAAMPLMIIVFGDMTDTFVDDGTVVNWWDEVGQEIVANLTGLDNVTLDDVIENIDEIT